MTIHETYYNRYAGWGKKPPEGAIVEIIMRNKGHALSPSYDLWQAWQKRKKTASKQGRYWTLYKERFLNEMKSTQAQAEIKRLAEIANNNDVWLVCSCSNKFNYCHRFLVMGLVEEKMGK